MISFFKESINTHELRDSEAVIRRYSVQKSVLENLQNLQENPCARVSFLISCRPLASNFIKKANLAQLFSCEFCEIFKNNFFYRTPLVAASGDFV